MGLLKPADYGKSVTTATPAPEPMEQEFDEVGRGYELCPDLGKHPYESGKPTDDEVRYPSTKAAANLLSSLCKDGMHRPVLDIDVQSEYERSGAVRIFQRLQEHDLTYLRDVLAPLGIKVTWEEDRPYPVLEIEQSFRLVPSSTEDHYHLYLDQAMTWKDYETMLNVLGEVGILESGYVGSAIRRQRTHVRPEGVKKFRDEDE